MKKGWVLGTGLGALILLAGLVYMGCAQMEPELIPREVLFGNPTKVAPRISPDGTMMAFIAPVDNVLNVWVKTIGEDDERPVTKDTVRGIRRYFWAGDSQHIMYLQDVGGDENWRLYGVDLKSDEIKDYTPYDNVQVQIVDRNKHFPNELLVGMNKDNPRVHDVYHLNLESGDLKKVAKNPGNYAGWVTDTNLKVRGAVAALPDGGMQLLIRDTEKSKMKDVLTWSSEDALNSGPMGFTKDGKSLYMQDSRDYNASRLVKLDLATNEIEVIAEDPQYDVGYIEMHPDEHTVQAVSFVRARNEWTVLDDAIKDDFAAIRKIDTGDFWVSGRDNADDTWLIGFDKDDGPVYYYAYDRETKKATFLFVHRPELNDYRLAKMEPVVVTARDGLTLHGYMTFPIGKGRKNLPVVLNVHGGPWARDMWGYSSEAQWFANRGYACLQINFRGSTGYGKDFVNAGDREWGAKMHDDLIDAVNWAIDEGYADPEKVAIYGGSYGGYAALVGATFTPDVFCCAVDIVGPSNLNTLIESIPPYWSTFLATLKKRVGDPETEREYLNSISPLFKADQIKIPMLIAQGANDPRVKQAEAEQIVAAMEANSVDYEYMLFPDEGHGFARPENRIKFYAGAEKFLAKHMGGRFETMASDSSEVTAE